jgi:hypothetical protein
MADSLYKYMWIQEKTFTSKAMGVNMGNALGKKMKGNDLRLRLGGGGGKKGAAFQGNVAFQQYAAVEEPEDAGDRWTNDMYFKSGNAFIPAPLRQAVPERAPSYLTTAGGDLGLGLKLLVYEALSY